jgi:DNA-binding transcriptional regulator YiaG
MDTTTKAKLEAAGFRETTVQELFALTSEENELVETRLALARLIQQLRQEQHLTQKALADRLGSDQGNVSKAEGNDASISIDWMLRAAFMLGATRQQIGRTLSE